MPPSHMPERTQLLRVFRLYGPSGRLKKDLLMQVNNEHHPTATRRREVGQSTTLVGRDQERRELNALMARAADGLSSELVIRGEPGIGKTALVEDLIASNEAMQVLRVAGAESEMGLPYAALHRLLLPHLDRRIRLPEAQREAIESAFGLISGVSPNLFLVGLGTLTLLADLAQEAPPPLCLIDDAHWLDEASLNVLAFVVRRLLADGIVLLCCVRDQSDHALPLDTFSELRLGGLSDHDAHSRLDSTQDRIERHVAQRIVNASGGNPLALTEFARGLSPEELAGGLIAPAPLPLSRRLEEHFLRRIRLLEPNTQRFLLIAAAEQSGDLDLLRRAADSSSTASHTGNGALAQVACPVPCCGPWGGTSEPDIQLPGHPNPFNYERRAS